MLDSIFPSLAVAAVALISARLGDAVLNPASGRPCAKIERSAVVWPYDATDHTAASSCPRSGASRFVVSHSPESERRACLAPMMPFGAAPCAQGHMVRRMR